MLVAGCGSDPLVGEWETAAMTGQAVSTSITMKLNGDGYASLALNIRGGGMSGGRPVTCSGGAITNFGLRWTATATTLSITGTTTCTGYVQCQVGANQLEFDCSNTMPEAMATNTLRDVPYVFSADRNTLTVTRTSNGMPVPLVFSRR
jgi:hypothetical protein